MLIIGCVVWYRLRCNGIFVLNDNPVDRSFDFKIMFDFKSMFEECKEVEVYLVFNLYFCLETIIEIACLYLLSLF